MSTLIEITGPECSKPGQAVTLTAPTGLHNYLWSTGSTTRSITVYPGVTTTYSVSALDSGDEQVAGTFTVYIYPLQEVFIEYWSSTWNGEKVWTTSGGTITPGMLADSQYAILRASAECMSYQWYLNGVEILGANSRYYEAIESGLYSVSLVCGAGCDYVSTQTDLTIERRSDRCFIYFITPMNGAVEVSVNTSVVFDVRFNRYPYPPFTIGNFHLYDGGREIILTSDNITIYPPGSADGVIDGYRINIHGIVFRNGSSVRVDVVMQSDVPPGGC